MTLFRADDGADLYYEDRPGRAERPPLVLLPGMLGSLAEQWAAYPDALGQGRRVIRADLRGHGRSRDAGGALDVARLAADLGALLDHLAIERCHLVGYSLGGYVGLQLESQQPGRLLSLLMHGTKFYWTQAAVVSTLGQMQPDRIQAKVPRYAEQLAREHGPDWPRLLARCADLVEDVAATGLREADLGGIACPCLVSAGDRDPLVPVEEAHRLSRALAAGQLLILPKTGHALAQAPRPLLLAAIASFIEAAETNEA